LTENRSLLSLGKFPSKSPEQTALAFNAEVISASSFTKLQTESVSGQEVAISQILPLCYSTKV
jgi:hypothetical protein